MFNIKYLAVLICAVIVSSNSYSQEIDIMSFNIGSRNWSTTKDSVIARIEYHSPDIFCAIEATGTTRPYIESSLTDYNMLQTFGTNPKLSESHIFYRKNTFSVLDSGYVEMETYGGYTGPGRYVNWARFEETSSKKQFLVYASHFVFVFRADPDSSTIGQYRHANGMIQLMNSHASLKIPMITVGDFNADSASTVMQFLLHQTSINYNSTTIDNPLVLNDSWYVANPSTSKPGTVGQGSTAVDWILTSADIDVTSAIIDDQGKNPNGDFPSDHRPLMITIDLTGSSAINMLEDRLAVRVYPNPFKDRLSISTNKDFSDGASLSVYNMVGEIVSHTEYRQGFGRRIEIDLTGLSNGLYSYQLRGEKQFFSGLILKE